MTFFSKFVFLKLSRKHPTFSCIVWLQIPRGELRLTVGDAHLESLLITLSFSLARLAQCDCALLNQEHSVPGAQRSGLSQDYFPLLSWNRATRSRIPPTCSEGAGRADVRCLAQPCARKKHTEPQHSQKRSFCVGAGAARAILNLHVVRRIQLSSITSG